MQFTLFLPVFLVPDCRFLSNVSDNNSFGVVATPSHVCTRDTRAPNGPGSGALGSGADTVSGNGAFIALLVRVFCANLGGLQITGFEWNDINAINEHGGAGWIVVEH